MKISSFIPGLSKAYTSVQNVFNSGKGGSDPYLVLQDTGVHHQCWYDIEIQLPKAVYEYLKKDGRLEGMSVAKLTERMNVFCSNVNVPSSNLTTQDVRIGSGHVFKIPNSREFSPIQVTFYLDGGYTDDGGKILKALQGWVDYAFDPVANVSRYYRDYACNNITVTLYTMPDHNPAFGKGGKETIGHVVFHEVYPAQVETFTLSGKDATNPTEITVSFNYRYTTSSESQRNTSAFGKLSDAVKGGFRVFRGIKNKIRDVKTAIKDVGNLF